VGRGGPAFSEAAASLAASRSRLSAATRLALNSANAPPLEGVGLLL
jgi:hypothetical protein